MLHAQLVEQSNRVLVDDPPEGVPKLQNQDKAPLVRLYEFLGANSPTASAIGS